MDLMSIIKMLGMQGAGGPPPPMRMPQSYFDQSTAMGGTGYMPSRMDQVDATIGGLPMEGPNTPEAPRVTAPTTANMSASTSVPAASVTPTQKKHGGLGGFLESVFMPEADSRWAAALRGGIYDAKANQQKFKMGQLEQQAQLAKAYSDASTAANKAKHGDFSVVGNNVFSYGGEDGSAPHFITPPDKPTETEALIDQWRKTPPGPERDLLERAIKGYQYTQPVIQAREAAKLQTGTALAAARGAQARLTKQTPGATSAKSSGKVKLPAGFILE